MEESLLRSWVRELLREASPVSPTQLPENNSEMLTRAICGRTRGELLGMFTPDGASLRTSQLCLLQMDSAGNHMQQEWLDSLDHWGTVSGMELRVQRMQEHPTSDVDYGFWPTPRASDDKATAVKNVELNNGSFSRKNLQGERWGVRLTDAVESGLWPTPRHSEGYQGDGAARGFVEAGYTAPKYRYNKDGERVANRTGGTFDTTLTTVVVALEMWPTPTTKDGKRGDDFEDFKRRQKEKADQGIALHFPLNLAVQKWPTPRSSVRGDAPAERVRKSPDLAAVVNIEEERLADTPQIWPTPTTSEGTKHGSRPNFAQRSLSNHPAIVGEPTREKMHQSQAGDGLSTTPDDQTPKAHPLLNADWVEYLMGVPIGWTSLEPLPEAAFQEWVTRMQDGTWWGPDEMGLPRVVPSTKNRVSRLKALGNGIVARTIPVFLERAATA